MTVKDLRYIIRSLPDNMTVNPIVAFKGNVDMEELDAQGIPKHYYNIVEDENRIEIRDLWAK